MHIILKYNQIFQILCNREKLLVLLICILKDFLVYKNCSNSNCSCYTLRYVQLSPISTLFEKSF